VNCAAIPRELIESELFGYERGAFSGASAAGKKGWWSRRRAARSSWTRSGLEHGSAGEAVGFLEDGEFYRVGGTRPLKVSARVVSATNKDLGDLIGKGHFREDLYYGCRGKSGDPFPERRREDILRSRVTTRGILQEVSESRWPVFPPMQRRR